MSEQQRDFIKEIDGVIKMIDGLRTEANKQLKPFIDALEVLRPKMRDLANSFEKASQFLDTMASSSPINVALLTPAVPEQVNLVSIVERLILTKPDGVILEEKPNNWLVHCGNSTVAYNRRTRTVSPVWSTIDNFLQMVKNK